MSMREKEREYLVLYHRLLRESAVFETMLTALGDMTAGCKIGIRYADRTLYVDKPSAFQGVVRWAYSQTRDKLREYLDTEIFDTRNVRGSFMTLLYEIWMASGEIIDYCATPARGVILSNELRAAYRSLCAVNVDVLRRVSHGLSVIAQSYALDNDSATFANTGLISAKYVDAATKRLKMERLRLEFHINNFARYIK